MRSFLSIAFLTSSLFHVDATPTPRDGKGSSFNLKPFTINLSHGVPHMIDLAKRTNLPTNGDYLAPDAGIPLQTLVSLRNELIDNFDWESEQRKLNKYAFGHKIGSQLLMLTKILLGSTISLLTSRTKPSTSSTKSPITPKLSPWFLTTDGPARF